MRLDSNGNTWEGYLIRQILNYIISLLDTSNLLPGDFDAGNTSLDAIRSLRTALQAMKSIGSKNIEEGAGEAYVGGKVDQTGAFESHGQNKIRIGISQRIAILVSERNIDELIAILTWFENILE